MGKKKGKKEGILAKIIPKEDSPDTVRIGYKDKTGLYGYAEWKKQSKRRQ